MSSPAIETLDRIALSASSAKLDQRGAKLTRVANSIPAMYSRDLLEGDLAALGQAPGPAAYQGYDLQKIRTSHHLLAMVLAGGASNVEASFVTGYSTTTISALRNSPAFKELMAYYNEQKTEEFKDFHRKAAAIGMDALDIIHERMQQNPADIKFKELKELAEMLMDRTVLPNKSAAQAPPLQPAQPITVIQFIDSPHQGAPQVQDTRVIEGTTRELRKP